MTLPPAPDEETQVVVVGKGLSWKIGHGGGIEVRNETYLSGPTWHMTSVIRSITRVLSAEEIAAIYQIARESR